MRFASFVVTFALTMLLVPDALAQGGGGNAGGGNAGGGGGRGRGRPEEITNRTGAFFTDVPGPVTDGDKVADLATIEFARTARSAGQLVVLYLYDSGDDQDVRDQFERTLFAGDELGIELHCFHCGRIDLAKEPALKAKYGKQAPLFVVFDEAGKTAELSMLGYKPTASALTKVLEKQAAGVIKPPLATFAKTYGDLVRDLEQLLAKKKQAQEKQAKAGGDKAKRSEADKELKALEAEEQKLLDKEKDLLTKAKLPERSNKAQRLGGRAWGRGGQNGGGPGGGQGRGAGQGGTAGQGGNTGG